MKNRTLKSARKYIQSAAEPGVQKLSGAIAEELMPFFAAAAWDDMLPSLAHLSVQAATFIEDMKANVNGVSDLLNGDWIAKEDLEAVGEWKSTLQNKIQKDRKHGHDAKERVEKAEKPTRGKIVELEHHEMVEKVRKGLEHVELADSEGANGQNNNDQVEGMGRKRGNLVDSRHQDRVEMVRRDLENVQLETIEKGNGDENGHHVEGMGMFVDEGPDRA